MLSYQLSIRQNLIDKNKLLSFTTQRINKKKVETIKDNLQTKPNIRRNESHVLIA